MPSRLRVCMMTVCPDRKHSESIDLKLHLNSRPRIEEENSPLHIKKIAFVWRNTRLETSVHVQDLQRSYMYKNPNVCTCTRLRTSVHVQDFQHLFIYTTSSSERARNSFRLLHASTLLCICLCVCVHLHTSMHVFVCVMHVHVSRLHA